MKTLAARSVLLLSLLLALGGNALGQNQMGIYFDEAFTENSTATTSPYQQVTAYLVLKDPSFTDGLQSWECAVEVRTNGPDPIITWQLAGQALNVDEAPSFLVGLGQLLPSESDVLLATATIFIPESQQDLVFYIHPHDPPSLKDPPGWGYPVFTPVIGHGSDGELVGAGWSSGCESEPVAFINQTQGFDYWELDGLPNDLNVGFLLPGESGDGSFEISNQGNISMGGTISLGGTDFSYLQEDGYYTHDPTWFHLEPGEDLNIEVRLTASEEIVYGDEMLFSVCGQEFVVPLLGGYIEGSCTLPFGDAHDFGVIPVGGQERHGFLVVNPQGGVLTIDPTIDHPYFTVSRYNNYPFPMVLQPGQSGYVYVTAAPEEEGIWEVFMDLGASACPLVQLRAQGEDLPPECGDLVNWEHYFGPVGAGQPSTVPLLIQNTGGGVLALDFWLEQEENAFAIDPEEGLYELGPGESHYMQLRFTPPTIGEFSAILHTGSECGDFVLTGTGREPQEGYTVSMGIYLPTTLVDGFSQRSLYINNYGETTISGDLQITGDPELTLLDPGPFTLNPGQNMSAAVGFSPSAAGSFDAIVSTGLPGGETTNVHGYGTELMPIPMNRLACYFDPEYTSNETTTSELGEVVTGYLVLHDPSTEAGIAGWELYMYPAQYSHAEILGWDVVGGTNVGYLINSPMAVLDAPHPPSEEILLGTVQIQSNSYGQSAYHLNAGANSPVPEFAAYIDASDGVTRIPMDDGEFFFCVINPGSVGIIDEEEDPQGQQEMPRANTLKPAYPNPFNPETTLTVRLSEGGRVRLSVFDLAGRRVRELINESMGSGEHRISWNGRDSDGRLQPSGVYYFRLITDQGVHMQKGMLLK